MTDSTAYLPEEMQQQFDVRVVPLCVHVADQVFAERVELSDDEFYRLMAEATELPTTSQPSTGAFLEVFQELVDGGHEILAITISSKLSGTWNSAMAAKEMLPEAGISVVDSLTTSCGLQFLIEAAGKAIAAGESRMTIVEQLEHLRENISFLFVVDTLEYLAKGGRIGNAKAFLGTLLKVKPILLLKDGVIGPLEQVRSKKKAQARLLDLIQEHVSANGVQFQLGMTQAMVPDEAQELADELSARLDGAPVPITDLGPVIGTHTGPGVIGIAVLCK